MLVGIDASNIRAGGGVTHLARMIGALQLPLAGIERVIVWGGTATLSKLPSADWLTKNHIAALDGNLLVRTLWQQFALPAAVRETGCAVLFAPGGSVPWLCPTPAVAISQNLLPFEVHERRRFGWRSWMYWKLLLLRWVQSGSFKRAAGVVFLTQYARSLIRTGMAIRRDVLIPHGIESRFFAAPRPARPAGVCDKTDPFRLIYVSIVDVYKHQDKVAEAVAQLRTQGVPVSVEFIGSSYAPALKKLETTIDALDRERRFMRYAGAVPFEKLHAVYAGADAFVYASSCENLPNILLEAMAARLPIACSSRGPMPEVLGDAGVYFDPEQPEEIARAIEQLYRDASLRESLAAKAQKRARAFTWERCGRETFEFIAAVGQAECAC